MRWMVVAVPLAPLAWLACSGDTNVETSGTSASSTTSAGGGASSTGTAGTGTSSTGGGSTGSTGGGGSGGATTGAGGEGGAATTGAGGGSGAGGTTTGAGGGGGATTGAGGGCACAPPEQCCGAQCVDVTASLTDCGACGTPCQVANGTPACVSSLCTVASCDPGYADCDGDPDSGCEIDTATDPLHCGACGAPCNGTHGTPACSGAACSIVCDAGFADCDGDASNGCEVTGDPGQGVLGYWPLDGSGAESIGGRDLTLFGGVGFAAGLFGQALDLHADATQYAARPGDDQVFDFGAADFTVQAWINLNTNTGEQNFLEKFFGQTGPGWTFTKLSDQRAHFWADPSVVMYSSPQPFTAGEWHQLVMRRAGSSFAMFYDGVSLGGMANGAPIPDTTNPLLVGRRNPQDGRDFPVDGRIDEVAIWSRGLSDAEVGCLWGGGAGRKVIDSN